MAAVMIFGGAGYIGTNLATYFLENGMFNCIYIADLQESPLKGNDNVISRIVDVRKNISPSIISHPVEWIIQLAAIHREPGHLAEEYFETNVLGAQNVGTFAERVGCNKIFFVSSISVYGSNLDGVDESFLPKPQTPYGISKLTAEYIFRVWNEKNKSNRLIIARPGVIFGPKDPGNVLRMILAIKKGYFFLPVSPSIQKSYGYIFGLLDSVAFTIQLSEKYLVYNYVEKKTESLGEMIKIINETLNFKGKIIRIPLYVLKSIAFFIHFLFPKINGIHPERVKKVAKSTYIIPKVLQELNFQFKYDFKSALLHWKQNSSSDF